MKVRIEGVLSLFGESSRRRWADRKILRGNARVRVDLRAPPTFSGPSRKWIFERSNRKCLFIASVRAPVHQIAEYLGRKKKKEKKKEGEERKKTSGYSLLTDQDRGI